MKKGSPKKSSFWEEIGQGFDSILNLPCNVYFISLDMVLLVCNEIQAQALGASEKELAGRRISQLYNKPTCELIATNNHIVTSQKKASLFEEHDMEEQENINWLLSLKFPLYNLKRDKLIGCYGFSFKVEKKEMMNVVNALYTGNVLPLPRDIKNAGKCFGVNEIGGVYLTASERKCLSYLIKGDTAKEIAKQLNISPRTVETHLVNLRYKLNCRNKAELIIKALENGII